MAIDGLLDRERRNNVFNQAYNLTGIYSCVHGDRKLTVIMYADTMVLNRHASQEILEYRMPIMKITRPPVEHTEIL